MFFNLKDIKYQFKKVEESIMVIYFVLIIIMTSLFLSFYFIFFKRPIGELLHATKLLAEGTFCQLVISKEKSDFNNLKHNFNKMAYELKNLMSEKIETEKKSSEFHLASQYAHDVRSPLAALAQLTGEMTDLPEETKIIIKRSVNRIMDISNEILYSRKKDLDFSDCSINNRYQSRNLCAALDNILSEKRIMLKGRNDIELFACFMKSINYKFYAKIVKSQFERCLSNILNNSIESIEKGKEGKIWVDLKKTEDHHILITIEDNGKGIPAEFLDKIRKKGFSLNNQGTGLGLSYAVKMIESWGGSLDIESELGKGTLVKIRLKEAEPLPYILQKLDINKKNVVVLDDVEEVHDMWKQKLSLYGDEKKYEILNFKNSHDICYWLEDHSQDESLYLFDYELINDRYNGLDIIEKFKLQEKAYLVTSHYENTEVIERCVKLGVKVIPKMYVSLLPVTISLD